MRGHIKTHILPYTEQVLLPASHVLSVKAWGLSLRLKLPLYFYYCCDYDGSAFIQRK